MSSTISIKILSFQLFLGFFAYFWSQSLVAEEIVFISLFFPLMILFLSNDLNIGLVGKTFSISLLYLIPLYLSYIFNIKSSTSDPVFSSVVLVNTTYSFFIASAFGCSKTETIWVGTMRSMLPMLLIVFVFVAVTERDAMVWGRWKPSDLHWNWWGMMALGMAWCSLVSRSITLKIVGLAIVSYFMVRVQSRGAIVALLPALLFCSGVFFPITAKRILTVTGVGISLICLLIVLALSGSPLWEALYDFAVNKVMLLHDPNRGLGSGMTGRIFAYEAAIQDIHDNPVIGNGFGEYPHVHNGFLLVLAESGILGLSGMIVLIITGLIGYLRSRNIIGFGILVSYIILLMTYNRSFNINMTGLLFLLVLMNGVSMNFRSEKNIINNERLINE